MGQTTTFAGAYARYSKLIKKKASAKIAKRMVKQFRRDTWGLPWYGGAIGDPPRKASPMLMGHLRNAYNDAERDRDPDDPGPLRIVTGALLRSFWGGTDNMGSPWKERDYQQGDQGHLKVTRAQGPNEATARLSFGSLLHYASENEYGTASPEDPGWDGEGPSFADASLEKGTVPPRPYFFPAMEEVEPYWRRRLGSILYDHFMFAIKPGHSIPVGPDYDADEELPPEAYDELPTPPARQEENFPF